MKKVAVAIHAADNFNPQIVQGLKNLDYIHVDVMDGKFVNNIKNNLKVFKLLKNYTDVPLVAHLMVNNPTQYIKKIIDFIDIFLFHFEVKHDKYKIIKKLKKYKKKIGIVINPDTEISKIVPYLEFIDNILIMSVYPGWSGQKFIPETINRVNSLAEYKKKYDFEIIVDGGIDLENAKGLSNADTLSSSSTILNAKDPNLIIQNLKEL